MNIKDFKVGDTVYIRDYNFRSNEDQAVMVEATVTKVGRSLVHVKEKYGVDYKFCNEPDRPYYLTQRIDAGTANKLFKSMQDYYDWKTSEETYRFIRGYFSTFYTNLTLDKLMQINNIITSKD